MLTKITTNRTPSYMFNLSSIFSLWANIHKALADVLEHRLLKLTSEDHTKLFTYARTVDDRQP
jgi:hypothetical protein